MSAFLCDLCAKGHTRPPPLWRCACGGPLSVAERGRLDPARLAGRPDTPWRYREAIGLPPGTTPVSLGERITPLVSRRVAGLEALFKLELMLPTGSFKDRGASVVVSEMASRRVSAAVEDSSGNAGAALAAYASRAGIEMQVIAPAQAPAPKLAAIAACGGRLTRVPGARAESTREALRRAASGVEFASHVWNPYFLEGTRTAAYEIWEQLGRRSPARFFLPVGNGSLMIGAAAAFEDLRAWGMSDRMPRLMGVQAAACAPLSQAAGTAPELPAAPTVADGIRIPDPPRARRMREAVARSGGAFLAVSEEEIVAARAALGRAGLAVEPTAAVGFAGALAWSRRGGDGGEDGPIVVALTGSALKVP